MALSLSAQTGYQNELAIIELISIAFRQHQWPPSVRGTEAS
jgi:hypothetical protein